MNSIANPSDIIEVDAETFYREFSKRKNDIEHTERVLLRDLEHYQNECSSLLMLKDYTAGLALEKSGRIISVFNAGTTRKAGTVLLYRALELGGNKLECNDVQQLRYIYGKEGFIPVSKCPLDENDIYYEILKSQENDYDHGTTLLFWVYDEQARRLIMENQTNYIIKFCNVVKFNSEAEAEEFRDRILEDIESLSPELKQYISDIIVLTE